MALSAGAAALAVGAVNPLLAPAHLVALIGLALLAGRGPAASKLVAAFALGLAGGLGAIAWGVGETPASDVLVASAALSGLIAAGGLAVSAWLAAPLALVCGVALGLDSPPQTISLRDAVLMLIGTACGGVVALAVMSFAASAVGRVWQGIALRVAGSWIAAIAILVLALRWAA
jgi:urease accessory protein